MPFLELECVDLSNRVLLEISNPLESGGGDLTARRVVENSTLIDSEKRIQTQLSFLHLGADDQTLRLVTDDVVSQLARIDDHAVRLHYLAALGTIAGGLPGPWPDALRLVTVIELRAIASRGPSVAVLDR